MIEFISKMIFLRHVQDVTVDFCRACG